MSAPRPILRVRRTDENRWLFLGYDPPYEHFAGRWYIEARPDMEGLWVVCGFEFTAERALDMLEAEVALMPEAMEAVRRLEAGDGHR